MIHLQHLPWACEAFFFLRVRYTVEIGFFKRRWYILVCVWLCGAKSCALSVITFAEYYNHKHKVIAQWSSYVVLYAQLSFGFELFLNNDKAPWSVSETREGRLRKGMLFLYSTNLVKLCNFTVATQSKLYLNWRALRTTLIYRRLLTKV